MAAHVYLITKSMVDQHFYNADGEMMFVPQQGNLRLVTEFGRIDAEPGEIVVIPRGVKFRAELTNWPGARLRLRKLRRVPSRCRSAGRSAPTAWPIRATSLTPIAAYEDKDTPTELFVKWGGALFQDHAAAFADRRGGVARQLRAPINTTLRILLAGRRHRLRPSRSLDLHGARPRRRKPQAPPTSTL